MDTDLSAALAVATARPWMLTLNDTRAAVRATRPGLTAAAVDAAARLALAAVSTPWCLACRGAFLVTGKPCGLCNGTGVVILS